MDSKREIPEDSKLERKLKPRQMNMIAIGGAIGTGLFVATGSSISTAGPGGTMIAYAIIGISVYFMMTRSEECQPIYRLQVLSNCIRKNTWIRHLGSQWGGITGIAVR